MYTYSSCDISARFVAFWISFLGTQEICPEKSSDHAGLPNEETVDVKEELGEIDNKFDEAREANFKCNW